MEPYIKNNVNGITYKSELTRHRSLAGLIRTNKEVFQRRLIYVVSWTP